jgi:hypothetical protein
LSTLANASNAAQLIIVSLRSTLSGLAHAVASHLG